MARIVFIYSTVDGHTLSICRCLQQIVERAGHAASLREVSASVAPDLSDGDRIVIGASVRYGKHRLEVARLIENNIAILQTRPSAFFSVNAVARNPEKRSRYTNPYVKKFLAGISWQPALVGVFGGKIDYPKYGIFDKTMIRCIMWVTKGPTDPNATVEFTDWDQVKRFGAIIGGDRFASMQLGNYEGEA